MSSLNSISVGQLERLVGTPKCPLLLDVRIDDDFALDPRFIPTSERRSHRSVGAVRRSGPRMNTAGAYAACSARSKRSRRRLIAGISASAGTIGSQKLKRR